MSQTSYALETSAAFAGMLVDLSNTTIRSYRNDDAVQVPFGLAVAQGAKDDGMKLPAAAGDIQKLVGITHNTPARNNIGETSGALVGEMVGVVSDGPIWVTVEEAVTPADPVFVRYASGAGGTQKGAFRKSADTTTAAQCKGARFLTSAAAGGLVQVEFDAVAARLA